MDDLKRIRTSGLSEDDQKQAEAQLYVNEIAKRGASAEDVWVNALQNVGLPQDQGLAIFLGLLDSPSEGIRKQAIWTLGSDYGPIASAAVPKLIAFLEEKGHRDEFYAVAARTLGKIGAPEIIPALISRLDRTPSSQFFLKTNLINALTLVAPPAKAALPVLKQQLIDPNTFVQYIAFRAIGIIQGFPQPSLSQVSRLKNLKSVSDDDLFPTFSAIIDAGADGSSTVPLLLSVLQHDARLYLKCIALQALAAVGSSDVQAVAALVKTVDSSDEWISTLAAQSLAALNGSQTTVAALAQALEIANPKVQLQAAIVLKQFGPAAAPAAASLASALAASDSRTSDKQLGAYLEALKTIGPNASAASDTLASLLPEQSPIYRNRSEYVTHHLKAFILATLADIGVPQSAVPYILDSLANSDDRRAIEFAAAARGAGKLGPDGAVAVPFLLRALKGEIFDGRFNFDSFLKHPGNAQTTSCRIEALEALAKIGPSAKEALPVLSDFISRYDPQGGKDSREFQASVLYQGARKAFAAIQQ